ncbi:MAG: ribosomal-processing cysteine protease Prp [Bacteroidaceae bacterium]|nr:ribosomal-processing cysteine protease Prp [Paraprevotella sp.]MDY2716260.1 ribosomal-processing cysteine protease Prp [Bacteroidaceae bacterium]
MLTAHFKSKKLGRYLILEVKGHAGAEENGKDLVCASASMMAYTVAQVAIDMFNDGKMLKKPTIKFKDGFAAIVCKPTKEAYAECLHTFHVAQVGYNLLQHNYPDNVRLIPFGSGL